MTERESRKSKDILATRPNGHAASPQSISRRAQGKIFNPRRESKENVIVEMAGNDVQGRPTSSDSSSDQKIISPQNTRIPRPLYQTGPKTSFSEAYKSAEEELAARGSPSPAPRTWRAKEDPERKRLQSLFSQKPLDFGHQRRAARRSGDIGRDDTLSSAESTGLRREEEPESDIDHKLKQYQEDKKSVQGMISGRNGLFSKNRVGPKVAETGHELARKTSDNSLKGESPQRRTWGSLAKPDPDWLKRVITASGKTPEAKNAASEQRRESRLQINPIPSIEDDFIPAGAGPPKPRPATVPPTRSPNKSFAWQADEDFTAGDLQVSNSPPVKPRRSSTKLDDLKRLEIGTERRSSEDTRFPTRTNTKLEELRQLELDAASRFPTSPPQESGAGLENESPANGAGGQTFDQFRRTNKKLDEIRAREIESLSRKALATARLDEIRERNSKSPSLSPEISRKPSREGLREPSPSAGLATRRQSYKDTIPEDQGERVPNTPVTIFRNSSKEKGTDNAIEEPIAEKASGKDVPVSSRGSSQSRDDSRDLLRRLSRVASNSPGPEESVKNRDEKATVVAELPAKQAQNVNNGNTRTGKKEGAPELKPTEHLRLTVGFAGLRRDPSSESLAAKRSSMAHSDSDPIERIEGEMKLFAPLDNHSERGSIRAPSPESDEEEEVEATPRPQKTDPLAFPTPKVTGAYVETPATLKIEKVEDLLRRSDTMQPTEGASSPLGKHPSHSRPSSTSPRTSRTQLTDLKEQVRTRSVPSRRARSRSLPRNRSRLINSAKPPTVKDDLLAIHRENQIEDSTLDDFADLLIAHKIDPAQVDKVLGSEPVKTEDDVKSKNFSDREELETYERMTQSLKAGLVGIHTAKQGIERLEHKVSHPDLELTSPSPVIQDHHHPSTCPHCLAEPPSSMMYIHVPVPRLWHTRPKFKFTWLGLLLFLGSFWYMVETVMWCFYGLEEVCYGPCTTPPDAPRFGYVIPVKLDQWTTGGVMRPIAKHWREEISDMYADVWDWCTDTDIRYVDVAWLDAEQRLQRKRRLAKRNLLPPFRPAPEMLPKIEAWKKQREERERAEEAREMGYEVPDVAGSESMDTDEPIFEQEKPSRWW